MNSLLNKNILLGISGGIAAYKTPDLVRKLKAAGANVRVVMTQSAKAFVSPLSLQAVSANPISDDLLDPAAEAAMGHIELAKWADTIVIAPATANIMAKIAHGIADDLLTTLCLASQADLIICPAMNQQMWSALATQNNLTILRQRQVQVLGPDHGEQACGDTGPGRMLEPEEIVAQLCGNAPQQQRLNGKRLVITAGPTREAIDPVRYLSNHSSGKMGFAIAQAAVAMGADVILVAGPVNLSTPSGCQRIDVQSAEEMFTAVDKHISGADIFIGCAAVADYRVQSEASQKIKKTNSELTLTLIRNPDILAYVAARSDRPFTVGFAAETQNVADYARAKLENKKLDLIAANDVSDKEIGFNSDDNALTLIWLDGEKTLAMASKHELASQLLDTIAQQLEKHNA